MTFEKELIQSAKEALEIAQGRAEPAAIFVPKSIDVAENGSPALIDATHENVARSRTKKGRLTG